MIPPWLGLALRVREKGSATMTLSIRAGVDIAGAGYAVRADDTDGAVTVATSGGRTVPIDAVSLSSALDGTMVSVSVAGPIDPAVFGLGAGIACAVGFTSTGLLCRATDEDCVSAPNWVGHCDALGTVTVSPRRELTFNPRDFGAVGDGATDDTDAFEAMCSVIEVLETSTPGVGTLTGGHTIDIPAGAYLITRTLEGPPATKWRGVSQFATQLHFDLDSPTWDEHPWGAGLLLIGQDDPPMNYGTAPTVENLAIYGVGTGTMAAREQQHAGAAIAVHGGGNVSIQDVTLSGFKTLILNMGCVNLFARRVNYRSQTAVGYPSPSEDAVYRDWLNGRNSTDLWMASGGAAAQVLGDDSAKDFASIVEGDTFIVSFDRSAPGVDNTAVTVTFQEGDTTATACASRINTAVGRECCSVFSGAYLKLEGVSPSRERGCINIQGGTAVGKLGFVVERVIGSGAGVGWEVLQASGLTNICRDIESQHNGSWVAVHEEDGANHEVRGNNFNAPGVLGLIEGCFGSVWECNQSEACQSDSYIVLAGPGGAIGYSWHFRHNVLTGRQAESPGSMVKVVAKSGPLGHGAIPYVTGGSIAQNHFAGSTGDGRALIVLSHTLNLIGFDLRGNTGYLTCPFVNVDAGAGCVYESMSAASDGALGVNTAFPIAHLDVRPAGIAPPDWGILYAHSSTDIRFGVSQDGYYHEMGQGATDGFQQGERVWFLGKGVVWASNDSPVTLDIDAASGQHLVVDVEVLMRETNGAADAVRHFVRRLALVAGGTVTLDTDDTEDATRAIGSSVTWPVPTLSTAANKITVNVNFPTTANKGGYWNARVRVLQRSIY